MRHYELIGTLLSCAFVAVLFGTATWLILAGMLSVILGSVFWPSLACWIVAVGIWLVVSFSAELSDEP